MLKNYSRLFLFGIIAFMLAVSFAGAAEFFVTITPEYQNIKMDSVAEYNLTIKNNMGTTENFEIYSPDVGWDLATVPASDKLLTISAHSSKTTTLQIRPLYVNPGLYGVALNVRVSGKNMLIRNYIMVGAEDPNPPPNKYLPAIRAIISMDALVDPREDIKINLNIENQNILEIGELDIKLRSNVINAEYKTTLGPLEKKQLTITIPIDKLTPPQSDMLRVLIFTTAVNRTFQHDATPFKFNIMQYGGIKESIEESRKFLKTTKTITLTNEGNGDIIDVYKIKSGFFSELFRTSDPEPKKLKEDNVKYIGWTAALAPYESITITTIVNYRVPFWLLCAALIIFILYHLFRSPITIHKSAVVLATKEGGISELKVLIVLKNRTSKVIKNVSAIDKVPHIADVSRDFEMGTLHPSKVLRHDMKGTLIKWDVNELERFEERVLAYKIKTRLSILGEFKLPVVVAKFRAQSGRERSTHSNTVSLVSS